MRTPLRPNTIPAPARRGWLIASSVCCIAAGLPACGGGGGDAGPPSGGDPPFGGGNGTLRVLLTDAPACGFDNVFVTVQEVRVHQDGAAADSATGWRSITLEPARRIDLLTLGNGLLQELGRTSLPAGRYTQLRLVLAENSPANPLANAVKPTGAAETGLATPSAQQSGLKLQSAIDVSAGRQTDFVLDFDACESVIRAGNSGNVILKPVLRGMPLMTSGVQGRIDTALGGPQTSVSLQQAGRVVKSAVPDSGGAYVLSPVAPGTYHWVMSAPGRATVVVSGVVVTESTLSPLGSAAVPLSAPASPTATLVGAVGTGTSPVVATVHALQALNDGTTVQVAAQPVAGSGGAYSLVVPTAAPLVAAYVPAPGALVFSAATGAAGRYTLAARSGTVEKTAGPFTLAPGGTVTTPFSFP
jgi:hypothetical protein